MVTLAKRMSNMQLSGIRRMFELAQKMKNPINLSLGQPDFDVPENVRTAAVNAIEHGRNGYTTSRGLPQFIDAVHASLARESVRAESVMAVAGASGGLTLALMALADEDCEVLITDPYFVAYPHLINLVNSKARYIDTYPDFKLTPERLRAAATPKSRVLIFNNPSNPTGIAYTAAELKALAQTTRELGIQVISDEVYDLFSYDFSHECWLKYDPDAILVRALSKTWGMPGWRAGYVAGPAALVEQMLMLQQVTFVCVHQPTQWAAVEALKTSMQKQVDLYRQKRDLAFAGIRSRFRCEKPGGAFYLFPESPGGDTERFIARCIEREILLVPGNAFSRRNTNFRLSFATDNGVLQRGLDILADIAGSM